MENNSIDQYLLLKILTLSKKPLSSLIGLKQFYNNNNNTVLNLTNAVRTDNQLFDYAQNTIGVDSADCQRSRNAIIVYI